MEVLSSPDRRKTLENPMIKTWRKLRSFGHTKKKYCPAAVATTTGMTKSMSWHGSVEETSKKREESKGKKKKDLIPPHGCFSVYVGPTKERVLVKTKLVNHPLFKNLLEDAEMEFGYSRDGPIVLPCEVDFFFKVLADMKCDDGGDDDDDDDDDVGLKNIPICGLGSPYRSCGGGTDSTGMKRYGSYKLLRSPSLFKLNRF